MKSKNQKGVSIFIPFYREMGAHMRYVLLPLFQSHKRGTESYVFPSKNQWTVRVHLKYWWSKLLRRKRVVCDGIDDSKGIQEAIDNTDKSGGVVALVKGEYIVEDVLCLSLHNPNVWVTGEDKIGGEKDERKDTR